MEVKDVHVDSTPLREDAQRLLQVTTLLGKLLLEYGAEVYRAEDTMQRVAKSAKNVREVDVLATPGWLFVSFHMGNESHTKMRRVRTASTNLSKVTHLNELSRRITAGQMTTEESEGALLAIQQEKETKTWLPVAGGIVGAVFFTFILGAGITDAIFSGVAAVTMLAVQRFAARYHVTFFVDTMIGAVTSATVAMILSLFGWVENFNLVIIGSIMLLFPGVGITNSMRDALSGDFISGLTHGMQALATALGIAIGVGLILLIMRGLPV